MSDDEIKVMRAVGRAIEEQGRATRFVIAACFAVMAIAQLVAALLVVGAVD